MRGVLPGEGKERIDLVGAGDDEFLHAAGHLAGAALDCFTKEPYDGPLKEMDNVILTPHIGSYAKEARIIMETDTIKNLLDVLFPGV